MEKVALTQPYTSTALQKVILKKSVIPKLRDSFFRKGFSESTVFPDLGGLAKELYRTFGFAK